MLNEYDPVTGTYSYGTATGLSMEQYQAAQGSANSGGTATATTATTGGGFASPYGDARDAGGTSLQGVSDILVNNYDYTLNSQGFAVIPIDGSIYNPTGIELTAAGGTDVVNGGAAATDTTLLDGGAAAVDSTVDLSNLATKTDLTTALAAVPLGYAAQPAVDLTGLGTLSNQSTMLTNQGTMGTSLTGIGTAQTKAATDAAANQAALIANQTTMGTGITDANAALGTANTNLTNLGSDVATGFSDATTQADAMQKAVLGGQTTINDTLKIMGDNADTYYGDLSTGQTTITDDVGLMQGDLNTLRKNQSDSNTLANQARADLAKSVTGGFDTVTSAQKTAADTASLRSTALQGQLQATAANNAANTFSQAATQISQGTATGQNTSQQDFINRLVSVRNIIATQASTLDASVLAEYTTLSNGFDAQGKLVQQSVDANGNTLRRGITEQGMLVTNTYNAQGALANQTNTDINTLISAVSPTGQFGDLSASGGGLMSASSAAPYIQ